MCCFRKLFFIFPALMIGVTGCGGSGQDDGRASDISQQFSGTVIDGYLARATVFIDANNNGTREAWEPFAFTDNDGYYSFNPITNTDYCADTATAQEAQYCLVSNVEYSNVVVRIDGGYDVSTGEPFLGQMSRRIESVSDTTTSGLVVSPLSSLVSNADNENEKTSILTSLGIEESDLDVNYLNTDGNGEINETILNVSLKVHKVVTVLDDRLTDTYSEIGEDFGTPNDASSSIYRHLASTISSNELPINTILSDTSNLVSVLDAAEDDLREVYRRKDIDLPADLGDASNTENFDRVTFVASQVGTVVDSLIDVNTDIDLNAAVGSARVLETFVLKSVNEGATQDTSIENVISFVTDQTEEGTALVEALVENLSQETGNLSGLINNDFAGNDFSSAESIATVARLPDDVSAFGDIANKTFRISDLDLGRPPNDLEDYEVEFYFGGQPGDIEGAFSACVKVIDGANIDGSLGEANSRGELVDGFWSLLGASQDNVESYSLLITITFLGATYQGIVKPGSPITVNDVNYTRYRFDNDGDLETLYSANGFVDTDTIPTSNEECQSRLPSRVGLD